MQAVKHIITKSLKVLLEEENDFGAMKKALEDLHAIFSKITGIEAYSPQINNEKDTFLEFGKAVSPIVAANCLLDVLRTKRFIQGVYKAILDLKEKFKGEKLNILYAGSGPYATLVLPLCFIFDNEVFKCTLIDIHEQSINAVRKLIKKLELEDYFEGIVHINAFEYYSKENNKPHIIISEVLQSGLRIEPQVALTHHLSPQLCKGGVFIPKDIKLDLYLSKKIYIKKEDKNSVSGYKPIPSRKEIYLGNILSLNLKSVCGQLKKNNISTLKFEPIYVPIPTDRHPDDTLEIQTELETYNGIYLKKKQSSLNIPITITALRKYEDDAIFRLEYKISDNPKVEFQLIHDRTLKE